MIELKTSQVIPYSCSVLNLVHVQSLATDIRHKMRIAVKITPAQTRVPLCSAVFNPPRWFTVFPIGVWQIRAIDPLVISVSTVQVVQPNPDGRQPKGVCHLADEIVFLGTVNWGEVAVVTTAASIASTNPIFLFVNKLEACISVAKPFWSGAYCCGK